MRRAVRFVMLMLLFAFLGLELGGCSPNGGIQSVKIQLPEERSIFMYICWPENSLYGSEMRRAVNNYNLMVDETERVSLRFEDSEQKYLDTLRVMVATATLPDVMILLDNRSDDFLQRSGLLMDLTAYGDALQASGNDLYDADALEGLFLCDCTVDLKIGEAYADGLSAHSLTDFFQALHTKYPGLGREAGDVRLDELTDSGVTLDFFFMLFNAAEVDGVRPRLSAALKEWKRSISLFDETAVQKMEEYNGKHILSMVHSTYGAFAANPAKGYRSVQEMLFQRPMASCYRCYFVATKQSSEADERRVLELLRHLIGSVRERLPQASASAAPRLENRDFTVSETEAADDLLRLFGKNLITEAECVESLEGVLEERMRLK